MKKVLLIATLISTFSLSYAQQEIVRHTSNSHWNSQERAKFLANRQDSSKWDKTMMMMDPQIVGLGYFGPFEIGAFPTPEYELIGEDSFNGVGNKGETMKLGDKNLVMNSFFVAKNAINEKFLGELEDEIFFQIIVLTDTINLSSDELDNSVILSRNHPDYLGQGYVKNTWTTVDYAAFMTAERNTYAIVNTRLFDLSHGKTILIAPQSDKTMRSMQIDSPELSSSSLKAYTQELLTDPEVKAFFE